MQHINPENVAEAMRLYLSDFVNFSHETQTDKEEMVCNTCILNVMRVRPSLKKCMFAVTRLIFFTVGR
jgi:hypothetical protein